MSIQKKGNKLHALSIHMKYGEVLHIDDINTERKDNYLKLCTEPNISIIVEDEDSIRNLLSQDVAKISVKSYTPDYRSLPFPVKKILLSESTLGRSPFSMTIKVFFFLAFLAIVGMMGLKVIDGTIVDVIFDSKLFSAFAKETLLWISKLFKYAMIVMILMNLTDFGLSYNAYYPVNRDGTEPIEISRVSNTAVIAVFAICYMVAVRMISAILLF